MYGMKPRRGDANAARARNGAGGACGAPTPWLATLPNRRTGTTPTRASAAELHRPDCTPAHNSA